MKKMLIAYYSWSNGNTERVALELQKATGADMVRIDTAVPYQGSYDDVVEQGQREVNSGFEPKIKPIPIDVNDYDVIAVGTPTWWYTMAPAILTFLHQHDLSGKTIVPFMTNGGWPGHVIKDIAKACKGAHIKESIEVRFDSNGGDHLETPESEIKAWTKRVKTIV